jgi:protein-S-isoprenylcysteine O-methyltransferase Ste14
VFALCFYIYFLGRNQASESEKEFKTVEAFFVGAARNPRNGLFDWKFFCESRPGLTFWVIISLSCMAHQYESFGYVTNSMLIASFMISLYIVDYYVFEDAILTTWDIVHEPFGWMLCWGSLIYVPFFYPLSSIWLADNPYSLPGWGACLTLAIGITGYIIFRQANIQKHHFRQNKNKKIWGKEAEYIQTQHGSKLLTSGWWGIASHANYLGDLMISLAMCLTVGTNTLLGYGYFLTFIVLLIQRDWRDNQHCANKYGEDWVNYRKKVKWHIIPGVY